jgi:hypothetical protein
VAALAFFNEVAISQIFPLLMAAKITIEKEPRAKKRFF